MQISTGSGSIFSANQQSISSPVTWCIGDLWQVVGSGNAASVVTVLQNVFAAMTRHRASPGENCTSRYHRGNVLSNYYDDPSTDLLKLAVFSRA